MPCHLCGGDVDAPVAGTAGGTARAEEKPADLQPVGEQPAEEKLRAIEQEGRRIMLHWKAIADASGRVVTETSGRFKIDQEVVLERWDNWRVLSLMNRKVKNIPLTLLMADAHFNPLETEIISVRTLNPPQPAPSNALARMRILEAAITAAGEQKNAKPPLEQAALREKDGSWHVYLKPKTEADAEVRFGTDLRLTISADGTQVPRIEELHAEETILRRPTKSTGVETVHIHSSRDLPTETDVALILRYPEPAPHLVLTPRYMFRIDAEGAITYLGENSTEPSPEGDTS